jgi:hypothetical protein
MARTNRPLIEPGRVLREYPREAAAELAERWLRAFAAGASAPGMQRFLWHVFSYQAAAALRLGEARDQYEREACAEYVVLSNERDIAFVTDQRPTSSSLRDWFVFPPNMAWTMAFTHEDGWLGPYFARHPQHAALDAENKALLKKRHESERARDRGWA